MVKKRKRGGGGGGKLTEEKVLKMTRAAEEERNKRCFVLRRKGVCECVRTHHHINFLGEIQGNTRHSVYSKKKRISLMNLLSKEAEI